jgi:DtxR family transcriptional regulator, Mn-dependent transcriptional regulator
MDILEEETLFVGTAEAEHVEMYLKAIVQLQKCSTSDSQA